jgi:glycine betaine/proline transport system permease protein
MYNWLTDHKLSLGRWVKILMDYLSAHAHGFFDLVSFVLGGVIDGLTSLLLATPPMLAIGAAILATYYFHRSIWLTLFVGLSLLLVANLGYWEPMLQTLSLVGCSTVVCVLIGVPLGILAAHRPWFYSGLRPILDLMQTIPTFVYLIPTLVLFGLGSVPGLISTVIFALPAPVRLTHLGISSVPTTLHEAALAFGATRRQLLFKVELPHAMPTIMAGVTQCIMLSLSMVVISALVGADGLGKPVVRALNSVNVATGFEAGASIVILAIILDRVLRRPS